VLAGHHLVKLSRDNKDKHEQSKSMEHVAEATAYIVGRQFGMPMEYSAVYLKQWGANPAELERHLATVRDLSKDMILGIGEQLEIVRREEQASRVNNQALAQETNHEEQILETFVRYQGRLYGEDQVTDLMAAFGASENLLRERVELLNNVAAPGEDPKFVPTEKLSAKSYQARLLLEFAESVGESEGAKFVWIDPDGYFDFAIDPDDIPNGVQAVPVNAEQELSVTAKP
jgi:hypothetical protein